MYTGASQSKRERYDKTLELLRKHASPAKVEEYIRMRGGPAEPELPPVLSINWNTVKMFLLLSSDWSRVGMIGAFTGIPSPAIESTQRLSGIALSPEEFDGLKLMEAAAKPILNAAIRGK